MPTLGAPLGDELCPENAGYRAAPQAPPLRPRPACELSWRRLRPSRRTPRPVVVRDQHAVARDVLDRRRARRVRRGRACRGASISCERVETRT